MLTIFNYLLISNIFTGAFVFNNGYFDLYIAYIFMASFLLSYGFFYRKIIINWNFFYILAAISFLSLINVLLGNNSLPSLLKIVFGFIFNSVTYYLLIRLNGNKVDGLFRIYLRIACLVALIGIVQEIIYLLGFEGWYDFRSFIPRTVRPYIQFGILRVTSIMQEPAHLGAALAPALFVSVLNLVQGTKYFISKKASCLVLVCVLLTFSLISYIGIVIAFILIMLNYRGAKLIIAGILILLILGFTVYTSFPDIRLRINDTITLIGGKKPIEKVNLSTFAVYSNGFVTYKSFRTSPLFGLGLGSHPLSYDHYISQVIDPAKIHYSLNREDASGLFLRLLSETGLLGIFLVIYFIFKFYVSKRRDARFWVISNAVICIFILNLLRQGNYFYNGFIFFVWLYYFTFKNSQIGKTLIKPV